MLLFSAHIYPLSPYIIQLINVRENNSAHAAEKLHLLTSLDREWASYREQIIPREKTGCSFDLPCMVFCGYPGTVVNLIKKKYLI